jgi:hypothetical protein
MDRLNRKQFVTRLLCLVGTGVLVAGTAMAQYGGGGTGTGGGGGAGGGTMGGTGTSSGAAVSASPSTFHGNYHLSFDRPEAWGLKYFASTTLLSGLQPPAPAEGYQVGSITIGLEMDWLPTLDGGQRRIGFNGTAPEDLNKAPILVRPVVRIGLPDQFSAVVAAPPPFTVFGLTPRLLEFGLERPLVRRKQWTLSWRAYGQVGSVKGAFTCPHSVLASAPGSPDNPGRCVGESADVASLRYAGSELQLAYRIPSMPKVVPHVAAGGNFIDGAFQVHAPVVNGLDETRLWTRGGTFSGSAGVSYLISKRAAFTVDAFYAPLWVQRSPSAPRTNDGLFNVRVLLSYSLR